MKKVVWTLAMLALTTGVAQAQDVNEPVPTPPAFDQAQTGTGVSAQDKALIANENKVADAVMRKDKATFTSLVDVKGWAGDASGFMKVSDFLNAFDQLSIKSYKISDEKVAWVDGNTAIVAYKWTGSGTFAGQPFPETVYASTVWTRRGDKWVAVFHTETAAEKK